jgi:hypothetical protein
MTCRGIRAKIFKKLTLIVSRWQAGCGSKMLPIVQRQWNEHLWLVDAASIRLAKTLPVSPRRIHMIV